MPTFDLVLKKQTKASGILTQPSRYKGRESNLLADEKGLQSEDPGSCLKIYVRIAIHKYIG